jgi:hypothetical protein
MSRQPRRSGKRGKGSDQGGGQAPRIVVKFRDHITLPYGPGVTQALDHLRIAPWGDLMARFPGITIEPLHTTLDPQGLKGLAERAQRMDSDYRPPNLLTYFAIDSPSNVDPEELVKALKALPSVETAYIQSPPLPPPAVNGPNNPRYPNQGYIQQAPGGIDAAYAWNFLGGDGAGIGFVDMEQGWVLNHEDLLAAGITLISGVNQAYQGHGTAVLGEITAVDNTIGDVGIVPHVTARVISQYRPAFNTPDAITAAAATMSFGDVLLLEAQVATAGLNNMPVEAESATFDAIRLATSLGIIVVEAGGNGSNDLDTFTVGGQQILNRNSAAFKDSGAIMVGAASSTAPHSRLSFSNYGSRIDCFAWGGNIDTTGDGWMGTATNLYTGGFGGTSGASPMVTGAAIAVQGMIQASAGYRFNPRQLRVLLNSPANSTASNDPVTDKIGRMPDLRAIINGNALNLAPNIYVRDFPADQGGPRPAAYSNSPDIIVTASAVADPTAAYGPSSGTENSTTLGDNVVATQDNFVYLRVLNDGGSPASNVSGTVYWSPPASLVTPNLWNPIGSTNIPTVPVGRILTVSDAINWPAAQVPGLGHFCFIALVGSAADPAPNPGDLLNWSNFVAFIQNNNQVAWHNFNVTPPPPVPPPAFFHELPFLAVGAPLESVHMGLEVEAHLPAGAKFFLDAPWTLIDGLKLRSPFVVVDKKAPDRALLPLSARGRVLLGEVFFGAGAQIPCRLRVQLPAGADRHPYEVGVRQLFKGAVVGRVSWRLLPPVGKGKHGSEEADGGRSKEERRREKALRKERSPA